jgi:hypothetical protein
MEHSAFYNVNVVARSGLARNAEHLDVERLEWWELTAHPPSPPPTPFAQESIVQEPLGLIVVVVVVVVMAVVLVVFVVVVVDIVSVVVADVVCRRCNNRWC